jgi:hypothetical protein
MPTAVRQLGESRTSGILESHMLDEAVVKGPHKAQGRRYHFDLIRDGAVIRDPGGLVMRDDKHAVAVGEKLARTLFVQRSELRGRHCSIKVRDERGLELAQIEVDAS